MLYQYVYTVYIYRYIYYIWYDFVVIDTHMLVLS